MTLIELPFVLIFLIIGMVLAALTARQIGWLGYPLGFFGGIAVSGGAVVGVLKIVLWISPERPVCRHGKCKSKDYQLHRVGDNLYWFCHCGDRYHYDRNYPGRARPPRFYLVREDGSLEPYMIQRVFQGWIPDTYEKTPSPNARHAP
jgi:hypothetical protein